MQKNKIPHVPAHGVGRVLALGAIAVASFIYIPSSAYAASLSWTSAGTSTLGGSGTWNTSGANWWNGSSAIAWSDTTGTTDTAVFSGTAGFVGLGSNVGALGLNFSTPGYVLSTGSSTLTLGTSGIDASALSSGTTTIAGVGSIALGGNQTWNVGSGATLNAANVISGATFGITKTGGGLLNLLGANTFTGAVTISGGTVGIVQDTSLGTASTSTVALDGGTLKIAGTNLTNTHTITVTANGGTIDEVGFLTVLGATLGNGGSGTLNLTDSAAGTTPGVFVNGLGNYGNFTVNGSNLFAGTININSGANLEYGSTTALSSATINVNNGGRISASNLNVGANLTVANGGNLAFQNGNAGVFSGTITLSGGTANVHMFDWYNYSTARNGLITGKITGSGGLNVFGPGNPTLTVQGANDYTGATVLNNAGLTVNGASGTIAGSSSLTAANSAVTLDYSTANVDKIKDTASATFSQFGSLTITPNTTADTTETLGTLGFGGGNATITIGSATGRVTSLDPSSISRTNNSTALVRGTNLNQTVTTNVARLILADGGASLVQVGTNTLNNGATNDSTQALKIVPYLFGDITTGGAGTNFLTYDSTLGLRVLTTSEQTVLSAGYTTPTNHDNAIGFNGTITASGPDLNSLLFNATGQTLNGSGALTIDSGAVASTVAAATIGSGFSSLALGNGEGVFYITTGTTTINTPISVTSGGGITKSGAGILTLTAANTFTGQTTVNLGTLSLTTTNNALNGTTGTALVLGNNAALNINATTQALSSITFFGSGETVSGTSGTLNLGGDVTMDTTANPNTANTISVSNLNLNSTRTFNVGTSDSIFTTSGTVLARPNLIVSSIIADGTGTSGLTKDGAGTLALTGANTYTGTTTITNGTLLIGNNGTTGSLATAGTIVDNGILGFSRTNTITQGTDFTSSAISGTGGITNFSTGTVVLNQANSFSGSVNIYNGTVSVANIGNSGSNSNLGTNGTINLGSNGTNNAAVTATLLYTGSGETTDKVVKLNGLTSASTSIIDASGSGLLKFTNSVTGVDGSKTLTLQGSGTGEMAAPLNNFGTGVLSVTKSGTGTWTLSGNNTFTGATTVNTGGTLILSGSNAPSTTSVTGTLQLKNANAMTGALTLNTGSTLQLRADTDTTFNMGSFAFNNDPTSGVDTTTFTIDLNAATSASNKTLTIPNSIVMNPTSGSRGNDTATINVTGASGYTLSLGAITTPSNGSGSTVIFTPASGLNLSIAALTQPGGSNPGNVQFAGAGNTTVTGAISGASPRTLNLTFNQTGTVTLNSAAVGNGGTFTTKFNSGTTVFNNASAVNNVQINLGNQTASSTADATVLLGGGVGGLTGGLTETAGIRAYDTTSGLLTIGGQNTSGTNTFSGTTTLGNTTNVGKSVNLVAAAGGTATFSGNLVANGTDTTAGVTINGAYTVNGSTVNPVGTVVLSGTGNTYAGITTVTAGKLSLTGTLSGTSSMALSGGTSTTLQGTGTVSSGLATVTNGSRIAPGVNVSGTNTNFGAAGTLNLNGGLTVSNANLDFDLSNTAASGNDVIALSTGGLTFNPGASLAVTYNGLAGSLDTGAAYTLISSSGTLTPNGFDVNSITSTFNGALAGNYTAAYSFSGTNLQVSFTAIPEPSDFALAIVGLLGLLVFIRRRNHA